MLGHNITTCENEGVRTPRSEQARVYAADNADECRERAATWKAENPNGLSEWLTSNPEKSAFYESRKDPDRVRETARDRYAVNPFPKRERATAWYRDNTGTAERNQLARDYGITPENREQIRDFQDGTCAIPGCEETELFVEHNHDTDQVRGLACRACNMLLGRLGDSADQVALTCARYLEYLSASGDFVSSEVASLLRGLLDRAEAHGELTSWNYSVPRG